MRGFRERALLEARRYGADPWVFVRELLQNSRDAGATRVSFTVEEDETSARIDCRDNGHGMTFEHARRYLFRLHASSKEGRRGKAGRFGVGFWSVLRQEPERITVRSWPRRGSAWEISLNGALSEGRRLRPPPAHTGTEVVLQLRPRLHLQLHLHLRLGHGNDRLADAVFEAAHQNARFLTALGQRDQPLAIDVNGRPVNTPFELPAPCVSFQRRGLRGVVGLGATSRVELFAKGLRVRSASCLEELLAPEGARPGKAARRSPPAETTRGLAPVALLDSDRINVLLSRDDARAGPALEALVRTAQAELDSLIEHQLDSLSPRTLWGAVRDGTKTPALRLAALFVTLASVTALGLWRLGVPPSLPRAFDPPASAEQATATGPFLTPGARTTGGVAAPGPVPYRDLSRLYRGPQSDLLEQAIAPVALAYRPPDSTPLFAALVFENPERPPTRAINAGPYEGRPCRRNCLDVSLGAAGPGWTRVPVPTGQVLDAGSLRVDGQPTRVFASSRGRPLIHLPREVVTLQYRTGRGGPGPTSRVPVPDTRGWPAPLREAARQLQTLPPEQRVSDALAWVRARVRYSTARTTVLAHAAHADLDLAHRALLVGAGDCDIQNSVLVKLLTAAGVPARLAVGFPGQQGRASPWLHAWVEHRTDGGPWRVADASAEPHGNGRAPGATRFALGTTPPPWPSTHTPVLAQGAPTAALGTAGSTSAAPIRDLPWIGGGDVLTLALALTALGISGGSAGLVLLRRKRRSVQTDPQGRLADLLRGVLQNPDAFAHLPAVLARPLLPQAGGGRVSLGEAWNQAGRGQLFVTRGHSPLARRAARHGALVLSAVREEVHVVVEALGAIDLDHWNSLLASSRSSGILEAVNAHLRRGRRPWRVRSLASIGDLAVLDLPGAGILLNDPAERLIVVDTNEAWLTRGEALRATRPAEALFVTLDGLSERLALNPRVRLALLGPAAREALFEAAQ